MKKGMSLIVLVITIIVMIVLAGVVVIGLTNNNPISKANEASFKSSANAYATTLQTKLTTDLALSGSLDEHLDVASSELKNYIPELRDTDAADFCIQDSEVAYIGTSAEKGKWANEIGLLNASPFEPTNIKNFDNSINTIINKMVEVSDGYVAVTEAPNGNIQLEKFDSSFTNSITRIDLGYNILNMSIGKLVKLANGNIAITGYTSNNLPALHVTTIPGYRDTAFVCILDKDLNFVASQPLKGTDSNQYSYGCAVNDIGNGEIAVVILSTGNSRTSMRSLITRLDSSYNIISEYEKILINPTMANANSFYLVDAVIKNSKIYLAGYLYNTNPKKAVLIVTDLEGNILDEFQQSNARDCNFEKISILSTGEVVGFFRVYASGYRENYVFKYNIDTKEFKKINVSDESLDLDLITVGYKDSIYAFAPQRATVGTRTKIVKLNSNLELRWEKDIQSNETVRFTECNMINKNNYLAIGYTWDTDFGSTGGNRTSMIVNLVPSHQ